jgi:hypothetical protein
MRRVLLATTAVLVLSAPAFADDLKIEKRTITREEPATGTMMEQRTITREEPATGTTVEKKTITREEPGSGSTVSTTIIAPKAPPALQVETPPPAPRPTEAWIPGHWRWEPGAVNFVWVHGHYAEPPRPHAAWVPGRWMERPNGWFWEEGRWD